MKTVRAKSGPFVERPHFSLREIEQVCTDELRKAGFYPDSPKPIRIDRFVEKRFGVIPQYEDLPEGVLGFTSFGSGGVEQIIVAAALDAEDTAVAERRIRSTLAHEAGHGLLHAYLFALGVKPPPMFFSDGGNEHKIMCRDFPSENRSGYDGRWWEFQANRAIGGLLMPRELTERALEPYTLAAGTLGGRQLDKNRRDEAVRRLSDVFDVNAAVIRIRLTEIFPEGGDRQLQL